MLAWNQKDEESRDPHKFLFGELLETYVNYKAKAERELIDHEDILVQGSKRRRYLC